MPKTVYCSSRSYRQAQTRPTSLLNCNPVQSKPLTLRIRKDERFWLAVAKTGQNWATKNGKVCPKSFDRLSNVGSLSYHLAKEVWIRDNPWSLKFYALSLKLLQVKHAQFNLNLSLMECYKRLKSLAKLQRHSLTKMFLTPFSSYSARESTSLFTELLILTIQIKFPLLLMSCFAFLVSWWEYVILYKMEDINKL